MTEFRPNSALRQDAGPGNALGRVAIRFPNPFQVYLHDTPSQRLFQRDQRALSSGCVRVEEALEVEREVLSVIGVSGRPQQSGHGSFVCHESEAAEGRVETPDDRWWQWSALM